jgi:hypothetical protein
MRVILFLFINKCLDMYNDYILAMPPNTMVDMEERKIQKKKSFS